MFRILLGQVVGINNCKYQIGLQYNSICNVLLGEHDQFMG